MFFQSHGNTIFCITSCRLICRFHSHFSRIQFTPNGGEKMHLTFEQDEFGPGHLPLMRSLARRGWSPTIICESAGTQAEDALTMKRAYEHILGTD